MEEPVFRTPSPLEEVPFGMLNQLGITLYVKRDDLIHPEVSGNKWRKLEHNLAQAIQRGAESILTFGGAHSNHIAATAAAGALFGIRTIGVIRGEEADLDNPTLKFAREKGMRLHTVSRSEFRESENPDYTAMLRQLFGSFYRIPQGGANYYGVQGCMNIMKEIDIYPDRIFVSCGTGTTLSGMALANRSEANIYGIPALKGGDFLLDDIKKNINQVVNDEETETHLMDKVHVLADYHFGGYARTTDDLISFMRFFRKETGIKTDPVYTGKAIYGMVDFARKNPPSNRENWIFIHTGGMQGLPATEAKLGYAIYDDC